MYVDHNAQLNAYVLPVDSQMLAWGQYSVEGYPSLQSDVDLIWNIADLYAGLETMETTIAFWPIPLCATLDGIVSNFQQYTIDMRITCE